MRQTVLITGAHGFLGRHTARHFAQEGWRVIGMGHGDFTPEQALAWGIGTWIPGDVGPETLALVPTPPDAVVHCAGGASVGQSLAAPLLDFERTVHTCVAVLEYVREHAPKARFVYPSSAAIYGATEAFPITEDTPAHPISPYGLHKEMAEVCCRDYAEQHGLAVCLVRFFSLYGSGLRKQLLYDACKKAQAGAFEFFGSGQEERDYLHVTDAARLMLLAVQAASSACPVINGASGRGMSTSEVLTALAGCWGEGLAPRFNGVVKPGDPQRLVADTSKAAALGFTPLVDFQSGLRGYVAWFKQGQP
jgi:UDP-glucose 4-epimerase